jgi:DNA-binding NarL/FixJ family response regulator
MAQTAPTNRRVAMNIRLLLIDDFPLIREGFAAALESDPGLDIAGQADDGDAGLRLAHELQPDVIVLDLNMPNMGGLSVLEKLRSRAPEAKVLVVTANERAQPLLDAVAAGATGYLTKRCTCEELRQAVITVHGGGSVISPALAGHLLKEYSRASHGEVSTIRPLLADREHEVLRLLARGHTDKEIGAMVFISPRTVQNHLTHIREKTGLRRRTELTRWAMEHALT